MELYRELIIDLYKNPLNKRPMPDAQLTASGANVTCGDRFRIYAKCDPRGVVQDLSFEGEGCAISTAAASILTEEAKGKTLSEISEWNLLTVNSWLGVELGPGRVKCGLLALATLQQAVRKMSLRGRGAPEAIREASRVNEVSVAILIPRR